MNLTHMNFKSNIALTIHSFYPFISSDFFYFVLLLSAINLHVECLKINVSLSLNASLALPPTLSLSVLRFFLRFNTPAVPSRMHM